MSATTPSPAEAEAQAPGRRGDAALPLHFHLALIGAEWRHHPGRVLLALLALTIGVALAYAVHLVNGSALAEFDQASRSLSGQPDLELRPVGAETGEGPGLAEDWLARAARSPGVELATPLVEGRLDVMLAASDPASASPAAAPLTLKVLGVDALQIARIAPDLLPRPEADAGLLALVDPATVYLNAAARAALGLSGEDEGAPRTVPAPELIFGPAPRPSPGAGTPQRRRLRLAGQVAAGGPPLAVMDIAAAQVLLGRLGRLDRIALKLAPGMNAGRVVEALALPAGELRAARPDEAQARLSRLSRSYRVNLSVLALVALFTGGFLVYAVQALAVARRVPMLALLGVLGVSARERRRLVMTEAALLGALGAGLGLALGLALARLALSRLGGDLGSAGMLGGLFGSAGVGGPQLHLDPFAAAVHGGLGLLAALAGSWWPASAAEHLPPAQSLKGAGVQLGATVAPAGTALARLWPVAALALGTLLALLPPWPEDTLPGLEALAGLPLAAYLSIACILLGGVGLVPATVAGLLALWPRPNSPLALLVLERARDQRLHATATIAGVVASLALCVALTVMVASFRDSVAHWLDQVLPADLYLRSAGSRAGGRVPPLPPELVQAAANLPGVADARPQRVRPLLLDPRQAPVALIVRPINLLQADLEGELPLEAPALPPRPGCIEVAISQALGELHGVQPGDRLVLPLEVPGHAPGAAQTLAAPPSTAGPKDDASTQGCAAPRPGQVEVHVRALWRDYARQQGALVMDRADWLRLGGDDLATDLALWLRPGVPAAQVQDELEAIAARLGLAVPGGSADGGGTAGGGRLEFATPGQIRALSLTIFDRSFFVTRWLQVVAIALGLVGVAASFSAQVLARRKEFGTLQHLGMSRPQVLALVAGEGALWCGVGSLLGLGLGGAIALILVKVVNPQSFHWRMDLSLPAIPLLALGLGVILAGGLAALLAGRAAAGPDMALAVKEDW